MLSVMDLEETTTEAVSVCPDQLNSPQTGESKDSTTCILHRVTTSNVLETPVLYPEAS